MRQTMTLLGAACCVCLAGCIYFTPATGLRLGDHSQEFPSPSPTASAALLSYDGGDFSLSYPNDWAIATTDQNAGGGATTRVVIGGAFQSGGAESLTVTTLSPDTTASDPLQALEDTVVSNLSGAPAFKLVSQGKTTLGGERANRLEATAQDSKGNATHVLAESTIHGPVAYVLVIDTLESRFGSLASLFDQVFASFGFRGAASPSPGPTPTASPT